MSDERGTGATTRQMKEAPPDAVYLWCNDRMYYPQSLARDLGRADLRVVSPYWLEGGCRGWRGPLVIDHAFYDVAPRRSRALLAEFLAWAKP